MIVGRITSIGEIAQLLRDWSTEIPRVFLAKMPHKEVGANAALQPGTVNSVDTSASNVNVFLPTAAASLTGSFIRVVVIGANEARVYILGGAAFDDGTARFDLTNFGEFYCTGAKWQRHAYG